MNVPGPIRPEHPGVRQSQASPLSREVIDAIESWTGFPAEDLLLISSTDDQAALEVQGTYAMAFASKLQRGSGKAMGTTSGSSEADLVAAAGRDIASMTGALARTVEEALRAHGDALSPRLDPALVAATGNRSAVNLVCSNCAGSAKTTCPSCRGSLRVTCSAGCEQGKRRCLYCGGTGQLKENCTACGGTRGTYSQPATWDHQIPNGWDWQQRQAASGGQWQPCSSCYGTGGRQTNCHSCQGGYVPCTACSGRGSTDCTLCNQTGQTICGGCVGGYNHLSYEPQVEVKESSRFVVAGETSPWLQRSLASGVDRMAELSEVLGPPRYAQSGGEVLRILGLKVPLITHVVRSGQNAHSVVVSAKTGKVLDFGGLVDSLLGGRAYGSGDQGDPVDRKPTLADSLRSPAHAFGVKSLGRQVGLAAIIPSYAPSVATVEDRFISRTDGFASQEFARSLVADTARAMRAILLKSHGAVLGVLVFAMLLLFMEAKFEFFAIGSASIRDAAVSSVLVGLAVGEFLFLAHLAVALGRRRSKTVGSLGLLAVFTLGNAAHWLFIAAYLALLAVADMTVAKWL